MVMNHFCFFKHLLIFFLIDVTFSSHLDDHDPFLNLENEINNNNLDEYTNISEYESRFVTTVEETDLIFYYYNRDIKENGVQIFVENVTENIKEWRKDSKFKMITHGWLSSGHSRSVNGIKDAYLDKEDMNIITLDWSDPASWKLYPLPAYLTSQVGGIAAKMIDSLIMNNFTTLDKIHVIGHSLGAHVAGSIGSCITSGKISRVTGLDPAGPAFEHLQISDMLGKEDAAFVDIIHTAGGVVGFLEVMGHADFYPNGGTPVQPGCFDWINTIGCSHGRAYEYFADSIRHPHTFKAYKCDSWSSFKNGDCFKAIYIYMGDETPTKTEGVFYLRTRPESPFGME